jgi:hypothetical protein
MSVVTIIRPWANLKELLEARALLYPKDIDDEVEQMRQRRLGVNIVSNSFFEKSALSAELERGNFLLVVSYYGE